MGNLNLCQGAYLVSWAEVSSAHLVQGISTVSEHPSFQSLLCYPRPRGYSASLYFSSLWDNLQPKSLFKILFIFTKALQRKSVSKNNTELNLPSDTTPGIWERSVPSGFSTSLNQLGLESSPGPSPGLLNPFLLCSKIPD